MTDVQLISTKTLYIIALLCSGLLEAQICEQMGFSNATISYVHFQHHSNLPKASGD
jgi:DNA-binding NarL/FixJ family response regulator